MVQIKMTDEQYRDLYFAIAIARDATRIEALNCRALGMKSVVNEILEEANKYEDLRKYITIQKEVL